MKTMTCRELGGGCDKEFSAGNFEEMGELAKAHGLEMFQAGDAAHLEALGKMQALMQSPQDLQAWFEGKRQEFEALAHN